MSTICEPGRRPCDDIAWVYDDSCIGWVTFGGATNVPVPGWRTIRPSTARSWSAWRTVVRETLNRWLSARSGATGVPGGIPSTWARSH